MLMTRVYYHYYSFFKLSSLVCVIIFIFISVIMTTTLFAIIVSLFCYCYWVYLYLYQEVMKNFTATIITKAIIINTFTSSIHHQLVLKLTWPSGHSYESWDSSPASKTHAQNTKLSVNNTNGRVRLFHIRGNVTVCRLFVFALNIVERLLTMITSYHLMYYDYSGVDMEFEIAFLKINWESAHIPLALFQKYEVTRK